MSSEQKTTTATVTRTCALLAAQLGSHKECPMDIIITLTEEQATRLLDIQENDKQKQDDAVAHIFELGLSARENSIKATLKRKAAEKAAEAQTALAKLIAVDPTIAQDATKLLKLMQTLGIVAA